MKFFKRRNLLFLFFTHLAFADTYVWEDYDDFSGSSLDSSKWGTKYLGGGIEPYVSGGKLILSATSGNPSATKVVKSGWEDIFQGDDGGQAWVYPKDTDIVGIETEFLIPSSTSSKSGLQVGVASLYPLSYATAELNADPNSGSQYSQGFGFYHLANDGSEIENFGTTQRDTTHRLGATLIDGIIKLYVDGGIRYQGDAGTFNTDMFYINGFNDYQSQGLAFELTADNVRVLRRVTTTSLDGSTFSLSSTDGVSETLSFENGVFTSTFVDPEEGTFVDTDKSYTLDQVSDDIFKIILDEGDTYEFNEATGTGSLVDYENGVIDTEGTWSFTFERLGDETNDDSQTSSGLLDGSVFQLASTDGVSETLSFENGVFTSTFVDPEEGTFVDTDKSYTLDQVSDDIFKIILDEGDTYEFNEATGTGSLVDYENGVIDTQGTWSFTFERHDWEDYDDFSSGSLDSSKWDVWWGAGGELPVVSNGALKLSGTGNEVYPASSVIPDDLTYTADLPSKHSVALINQDDIYGMQAEFMIPSNPSDDTGLNFIFFDWASDGSKNGFGPELEYRLNSGLRTEFAWTDPDTGVDEQLTRSAQFDTYYKMSLIHTDSTNSMYLNGELIEEFSSAGFSPDTIGFAAFNDDGLPYETYVKNVRVLRRNQTSTEPDPVTVVSDPNGQAVVVQVGDEYKWNSTLDGVTLWGVWEDSEDGWIGATVAYENGVQKASIGLTDELGSNLEVNHPYIIDENGMIKVTEDTAFQYYQVTAVENGVITTADDSSFPLSDTSKFFTTRSAAEEYYYSKANPKDWMWFDYYPWVYSEEEQGWLYFYPSGGKLLYYSNKSQVWREFNQ
ncbi:hypothetical protein OAN13_06320 [Opitutales bacterium]|nr:hypothetical protein [Opitutales bacterium]